MYLLNGTKVADGFLDMWDGDILAPIDTTQFLIHRAALTWSGSGSDGFPLRPLGNSEVELGNPRLSSSSWIASDFGSDVDISRQFYALSEELTVPGSNDGAVPEAASVTVWLCLASLVGLIGASRRWTA